MFHAYSVDHDGSVFNNAGELVSISNSRFENLVGDTDICFLCCTPLNDHNRNREHIIPQWIQRVCDLQDKTITLPNGSRYKYDRYILPACVQCNSFLGTTYENPISIALENGDTGLRELVDKTGLELIFEWACLLFIKCHWKAFRLREHRDQRIQSGTIGDTFDEFNFHHVHAVARSRRFGVALSEGVMGTVVFVKVSDNISNIPFDFSDHYQSKSLMIRIRDTAIIVIFDDSGATIGMTADRIGVLDHPIRLLHLAEIFTEYQSANLHIANRPTYGTRFNFERNQWEIYTSLPDKLEGYPMNFEARGALFERNMEKYFNVLNVADIAQDDLRASVRSGKISFLRTYVSEFTENIN